MKKIILLFFILLFSHSSLAWYCNEVASERNGDTINACGIGEAEDEDVARKLALNNAYKELDLICSRSADCAGRGLEISPLRTDCKKVDLAFRCHRGITARVTNQDRDPEQKALLEEVFVGKKIVQVDGREQFVKSSIIDFESDPSGAMVYVDGVEICSTPCSSEVNQGEHKILFEKSGFDLLSKIILVKNGRQSVSVELKNTYGYLTLKGLPSGAVVKIDNKETISRENIRLLPNHHVVSIESKYHQPWHREFEIAKGEQLSFSYDSQSLMAFLKVSVMDNQGHPLEAAIFINDKKLAEKTPAVIQVPAGKSHLIIRHSGQKDLIVDLDLDVDEKIEIKKQMIPSNEKNWAIYFGIGVNSFSFDQIKEDSKNQYSCCVMFDLSLQRSLTKHIAIRGVYNYISGSGSSDSDYTGYYNGTPNTTEYLIEEYTGHLLGISLPIYFYRSAFTSFFIAPEMGNLKSKMQFKKIDYDATGYGFGLKNSKTSNPTQNFKGILSGFEWIRQTDKPTAYGGYLIGGFRTFDQSSDKTYKSKGAAFIQGGLIVGF